MINMGTAYKRQFSMRKMSGMFFYTQQPPQLILRDDTHPCINYICSHKLTCLIYSSALFTVLP